MKKNSVVVYFRVIAMLMIVIFHCYCYNFGVWPFLIDSPPPYGYSFSPLIFSTLGLSIFVVISGYLYGLGTDNVCLFSHICLLETIIGGNSSPLVSIDAI